MNLFKISWQNLINKKLSNALSILLLALGVALILFILLIGKQLDDKFTKNIKGIDMVVGAKGSPLQLILSSIYQLDSPTGNISLAEANTLAKNPLIKSAIPIAMGDSYMGNRIIGTNEQYLKHYKVEIEKGVMFNKPFDCVIGASIAKKLQLKIGDNFESAHGLDKEAEKHKAQKYKIVGIAKFNNSVIDQLIITPLESVWEVHDHPEDSKNAMELLEENHSEDHQEDTKQITAMLVKFRNPMGLMMIPRNVNANTNMQAALPAIEINRMFSLMGVGIETLKWIALLIIFISAISVFINLYNSLKERKYEMALMLSMGATKTKLFLFLLSEGLLIGILGYILGVVLSRLAMGLFGKAAEQKFNYDFSTFTFGQTDGFVLLGCLGISLLAAALASFGIYKINISKTLAEQ